LALEVMESIVRVEKEAEEILRQASEEARGWVQKAEEEMANLVLQYAEKGLLDARQKDSLAEKEAQLEIEASTKENAKACEAIRQAGAEKMDQATRLIVERIVDSFGYH